MAKDRKSKILAGAVAGATSDRSLLGTSLLAPVFIKRGDLSLWRRIDDLPDERCQPV